MEEKKDSKVDSTTPETGAKENVRAVKYGVLGALAAVICCVGPLVPILLGLGGATMLFGLDQYKPWFITLGLVVLASAAGVAVRRQNRCCAVKSTARSLKTIALVFGVGIGSYLVLQYAVVPALASVASSKVAAAKAEASANGHATAQGEPAQRQTVDLQVDGMTCAGCAVGVESALLDMPGVLAAEADWKTGNAVVEIDPTEAKPVDLLDAKVEENFNLKLK